MKSLENKIAVIYGAGAAIGGHAARYMIQDNPGVMMTVTAIPMASDDWYHCEPGPGKPGRLIYSEV